MSADSFSFPVQELPDPPEYVFGLATPAHMLRKLYWEIKRFKAQLSECEKTLWGGAEVNYCAFNVAVIAFHCAVWAWRPIDEDTRHSLAEKYNFKIEGNERSDLVSFIDAVCADCRSIEICKLIANGSKHMGTRGKPKNLVAANVVWDFRSPEQNPGPNYYLEIVSGDEVFRAEDIFQDALNYWERLFRHLGYIEDQFVDSKN